MVSRYVPIAKWLVILAAGFTCAQTPKKAAPQKQEHMTDEQMIAVQANQEHVAGWLDAIDRSGMAKALPRETRDWTDIPDAARVRHYSEQWCQRFFRPEFDPYQQAGEVKRGASPAQADTFDVLRHEYAVQGTPVEVLETAQFTLVRGESASGLLRLPESERRQNINTAAATILNLSGKFQFPASIAEGALFSTNPTANPITLRAWTDRVDGGIRHGRLFFLCYKRIEPTDGRPVFLNGQHWFDGKCWEMAERRRP